MAQPDQPLLDSLLDRLVQAIKSRHDPQGRFFRFAQWLRKAALVVTWGYAAVLVVLLACIEWAGERHWLLSFFLFLPAQGWLLPLAVLSPFCLLVRPKMLWVHACCVFFVLVVYMNYEWSGQSAPRGKSVKLLTNNIGESNAQRLTPFVELEQPDIITLQDAMGRAPGYARQYTNSFVTNQEQHVIISKWPIKSCGLVPVFNPVNQSPVAAWFELDCDGKPLVVYSVHLPTPRAQLESMRGIGFLAALAGRGGHYGSKVRQGNQHFWDDQLEMARGVLDHMKKEQQPVLIAGDFNVPNHGCIYHMFAGAYTDSFAKRGRGYGFSFPGFTHNPLTLFGPWLRLDCIYSSDALRPVYCRAEPDRKSQHRAVVATFEFKAD